jgi:hypothetical protein
MFRDVSAPRADDATVTELASLDMYYANGNNTFTVLLRA